MPNEFHTPNLDEIRGKIRLNQEVLTTLEAEVTTPYDLEDIVDTLNLIVLAQKKNLKIMSDLTEVLSTRT